MTFRHLNIFTAVCEYGGMTKAAEALHVTQPAISHAVSELEKYYNIVLFERINQRLVLTEQGKQLLVKAKALVKSFEEFETFAMLGARNERVRIGASLTLGQTVMNVYLRRFSESPLQRKLHILVKPAGALLRDLENGMLDFALTEEPVSSPYLETEIFYKDCFILAAHRDFEVSKTICVRDLHNYPLLLRGKNSISRSMLEEICSKEDLFIEPIMESESDQVLCSAAISGAGMAFLPKSLMRDALADGICKEIKVVSADFSYDCRLVKHKDKQLTEAETEAYSFFRHWKI